jgi:hypothetical protein
MARWLRPSDQCSEHQIRRVESSYDIGRFTCVMYALDIVQPPPVIVELACWDCYPSPGFLGHLIAERVIAEVAPSATTSGDLVVYSLRRKIEHVGLVDDDQVLSKWGVGHLWRHPLFEVPSNYGSSIRHFRPVPREVVVGAFLRFARQEIGDAKVDRCIQKTGFLRPP